MNIMHRDHIGAYAKKWNLSDVKPINVKSSFSDVAMVTMANGDKAVLKVLSDRGMEVEENGSAALNYFKGDAMVRLYQSDERAHLLEFIDGPMLTAQVKAGEDEKSALIICDVIECLHENDAEPENLFKPLQEHFSALFECASKKQANPILTKASMVADILLHSTENERPLHGDLHHDNILHSSTRGWVAIDPHGLYGDVAYEYANAFNYPVDDRDLTSNPDRIHMLADVFVGRSGIDKKKILQYAAAHMGLSSSWRIEQGRDESARGVLRSCDQILKLVA
ncbi:MAG: hypothetical protein COB76_00750 [Alphaproteobacteria bacterium]|nr:MAG: hypothetical protein COB76_00750 [Alphaproteobacteria bacterium]